MEKNELLDRIIEMVLMIMEIHKLTPPKGFKQILTFKIKELINNEGGRIPDNDIDFLIEQFATIPDEQKEGKQK